MNEEFSARTRTANLEAMAREPVDVLVIGGGIVGAWTALTAALRGHRTALVEKGDFASGTSGKTSRLIHGGLRYLQQLRIGLVRTATRERNLLLRIAPDLVRPLTFLIPVYRDRGPRGWQLRFGLWLYDAVSKDRALPRRRWLTREEALAMEPGLAREGLVRAATYADAITRDARLVISVIQKASGFGALVANYARVLGLTREAGQVVGARIRDEETGGQRDIRANVVVNATGVWVGDLQMASKRVRLRPTKGIHVLVPQSRTGVRKAITLPTKDRRIVFVLPWGDLSLIGTTDTDYSGDRDRVEVDREDIDYLLEAVNAGFPGARLIREDVVSAYAGLRPLIDTGQAKESDISRKHRILTDPDGLISVAGGKLTTARSMAEAILSRVETVTLARAYRGASVEASEKAAIYRTALTKGSPLFWSGDSKAIELAASRPVESNGDLAAAARRGAKYEMAIHLDDVLVRRTGLFYELADQGAKIAPTVVDAMGAELGWDAERRASELERFRRILGANRRWREAGREG